MSKKSKETSQEALIVVTRSFLKIRKKALIIFLLVLLTISSVSVSGWLLMLERFYPGTIIANTNVSFLTKEQASHKVKQQINKRLEKPVLFSYENTQKEVIVNSNSFAQEIDQAITKAFAPGHTTYPNFNQTVEIDVTSNKDLQQSIIQLSSQININPIDAQLKIEQNQINVTPSQSGLVIDSNETSKIISAIINNGEANSNKLPLIESQPKLSYETALEIKKRLDQIRLSPLQLTYKTQTFNLDLATLLSLIDLQNSDTYVLSSHFGQKQFNITNIEVGDKTYADAKLLLNTQKATEYFNTIAPQIDREVKEPLFAFDPNSETKIKEFQPPIEGQKLQIDIAIQRLSQALLTQHQTIMELPVEVVTPTNKLSNELGIKELVGTGVSNYAGSIENRAFNVYHGASKINGVLIPPGEVFSFNKTVGDITAATGFKQAYVIKSGRTVLDDGGGICQVSTTLFRAALNAGLPIVNRVAHAYRVTYYEQGFAPGLDATIFYPSTDFQFRNDTPNHLLIQTTIVGTTITIDLYGTSDGRTVELSKPVITSVTPAPPELRQDDPTLPKGTIKQVDWAANGANVSFKRVVRKNDGTELINETFRSNYRPWQAVYLVGTKEG